MIETRDQYMVGFLCTLLYFLTAIWLSNVIFSYIAPFVLHFSLLLILYRLDYQLEWFVFSSALLAIFYPFVADYLESRGKLFFKYPLIATSLGGLFFSALSFLILERLENTYLPAYLFLCGILILNKIAQIRLDPRYLLLGIPLGILVYVKHLVEFDLALYWIGLLLSTLSVVMTGVISMLHRRVRTNRRSEVDEEAPLPPAAQPVTLDLEDSLIFLTMSLIIFSLPIDLASYIYLVSKLTSLEDLSRLYSHTAFSFDLLGEMWKGLQISIYYLSHFSFVSLVIMFSTLFTAVAAGILSGITQLKFLGFYSITAFLGFFTIALIKYWHPLLYADYYFVFYLGLALLSFFLIGPVKRSKEIRQVLTLPLYLLAVVSFLVSYVLAGLYFDFTLDKNLDYYLSTLSLLGGMILLMTRRMQSVESSRIRLFGTLLMIAPLCMSSFVNWTFYLFFIFATLTVALGYLIYGWIRQERIFVSVGALFLLIQIIYILTTVQPGQVLVKLILLTLGIVLIGTGVYLKRWNAKVPRE